MSVDPIEAQTGMQVFGSDAEYVGRVHGVDPQGIVVVSDEDGRHYAIPRRFLYQVSDVDYRVDLNITGSQAEELAVTDRD